MKKEILKIAGVNSEKEFYEKYPTEEAFMAKHGGAFKKAKMGKSMVKKQLTQLTDFANPPQAEIGAYIGGEKLTYEPVSFKEVYDQLDYTNTGATDAMRAQQQAAQQKSSGGGGGPINVGNLEAFSKAVGGMKRGGKLMKAQNAIPGGIPSDYQLDLYNPNAGNKVTFNNKTGMVNSTTGQVTQADTQALGMTGQPGTGGSANPLGQITQYLGPAGQVVNAVTGVIDAFKQQKQAKQNKTLAQLSVDATASGRDITRRSYVTSADMSGRTKQPGQAYGETTGNVFLSRDGSTISGNPTEIQNMYNPGDLYSDLGYEPLEESDIVKQYRRGGSIPRALTGQMIGAGAQVAGDIVTGIVGLGTQNIQKQTNKLLGQAAFQSGMQGTQDQYSGFMEDGGWVSHDWQPQVITQFGGYNVKDLLKPDETMNTLRSGGHIAQLGYTAPSERAMSTERPNRFALGGELQTHWGGEADVVSYNPYLEDGTGSGESIQFKGKYHSQSAGNGKTGIGITFGENPVEVENGEPGQKMKEGGSTDDDASFIVFGAKDWSPMFDTELNFPTISGKKIKSRVTELNKLEAKQNKIMEKANDELANLDPSDAYDMLKFNSLTKKLEGADDRLGLIAQDKKTYAAYQEGVLDTWKNTGLHPDLQMDDLLKGKVKFGEDPNLAKFGTSLEKAQKGAKKKKKIKPIINMKPYVPTPEQLAAEEAQFYRDNPQPQPKKLTPEEEALERANQVTRWGGGPKVDPMDLQKLTGVPTAAELAAMEARRLSESEKEGFDWMDLYNTGYQAFRPGIKNSLAPEQTAAEMLALAQNQPIGVAAQSFQPILEDMPAMVVFQDQLNEIQAEANASKRLVGNNPAALAMIDAQVATAKNRVLAEQFRMNQGLKMETMRRNIASLNDATLKNLAIYDQQYVRGQESLSKTRGIAQSALASIADKIGKNKAETLQANVMANMYPQFRFSPTGRMFSTGLTKFDTGTRVGDMTVEELKKQLKTDNGQMAKNGSLVKAIKNL